MMRGSILSHIDVAQLTLYAFWIFFAGLIWYLRREDRREGYPLENEAMGGAKEIGFMLIPKPKIFRLEDGTEIKAPNFDRDNRELKAVKTEPWPGAPLTPVGDPMLAEIGPGAYALRADVTEKTHDGRDLIVPIRVAPNYTVAREDRDPVGMQVMGADRKVAGTIKDIWVDRGECMPRYYEVELGGSAISRSVLLPVNFANVKSYRGQVIVDAILSTQFQNVPLTKDPNKVTMLEEEKVMAYYGAGTLYATPRRSESVL